ncbi:MAG TPA: beta-propeller fold lactonase family protein [Terracidiphilus sp.]|nr:beta-propeller fold lactonase family protein [Terracidiphilus sp.]
MRKRAWIGLALAAPLMVAGCKGFWDAPATGGTGGGGTTTASSGNFYVLDAATTQIAGYSVKTGTVTALPGSPYAVPNTPTAIAMAPNGTFLYVSTPSGIYLYSVASSGQLTLGNAGAAISADPAQSLQVDATNSWLVEVVSGAGVVYAIPVNPATGMTTSTVEEFANLSAITAQQLAISPDDLRVFVAMGAGGTAVVPFTSGSAKPFGAVTTIPVVSASGAALSVAVDPSDRLFYIGETAATGGTNTGGLRVFNLATMQELTGSPFASQGLAPYGILPIASGNYVYVVNRQVSGNSTGLIAGFSIATSNATYALTALGSTFRAGTHTVAMAEDSTGSFVFAVNFDGSPDLTGYTFDTTNAGYLNQVISVATGTDPVNATAIAAAP